MNTSKNIESGDIVSITMNTDLVTKDDYGVSHDHGSVVVGEVHDVGPDSIGLYLAPELEVHVTIPAECVVSVEVVLSTFATHAPAGKTCGQCRHMGVSRCEAFLPPEDDIFQIHEVMENTPACSQFEEGK